MSLNWKDIAENVGKFAPMLGGALGGPGGAAIGSIISSALGVANSPDAVSEALKTDPQAAVRLAEIESNERVKLREFQMMHAQARMTAAAQNADSVNRTMQAEANSERWPTYWWRPLIGMAVAFNVTASSLLVLGVFLPLMFGGAAGAQASAQAVGHLPMVLGALAGINGTVLPILGIASWFRGKMQADPNIPPATALPVFGAKQ
jgi:roadblock/LC7 domain-containing protein